MHYKNTEYIHVQQSHDAVNIDILSKWGFSRALCLLEVLFQVLGVPRPLHLSSVWIRQLVGSRSSCSYHPVRAFPFRAKSTMVRIPGVLVHLPQYPISCSELPHAYVLVVITHDPLLALGHFLHCPFPFLLQQVQT